jgi:hypothetical protein
MLLYMKYLQAPFRYGRPPKNTRVLSENTRVFQKNTRHFQKNTRHLSPKHSSDFRKHTCFRGCYGT